MVLPASGPISINDVATEFGGNEPHSLTEYYRDTSFIVRNNVPTGEAGTTNPNNALVPHRRFTYGSQEVTEITIPEDAFSTGTTRTGEVYIAPTGTSGTVPGDGDVPISVSASGTLTPTFSGGNNGVTDTSTPNEDVDVDTTITPQSVSSVGVNGSSGNYTISQNNAGETFSATWNTQTTSAATDDVDVTFSASNVSDDTSLTATTTGNPSGLTISAAQRRSGSLSGAFYNEFSSTTNPFGRTGRWMQTQMLSPILTVPNATATGSATVDVSFTLSGTTNQNIGVNAFVQIVSADARLGTSFLNDIAITTPQPAITALSAGNVLIGNKSSAAGGQFNGSGNASTWSVTGSPTITLTGLAAGTQFRIHTWCWAVLGQGGTVINGLGSARIDATVNGQATTTSGPFSGTALGGLPSGSTINGGRTPTSYSIPSNAVSISGDGTAGQTITGGDSVISTFETGSLTGGIAGGAGPQSRTLPDNVTNTHYFFSSIDTGLTQSGRTVTAGASTISGNTLSGVTVATIVNNTGVALSNVSITFTENDDNGTIQYNVDNGNFGNGPTVSLGSFTVGQSKVVRANLTVNAVLDATTSVSEMFTITGTRTVTRFSYSVTNNASVSVDVTLNPQDGNAVTVTLAPSATRADVVFSRFNTLSAFARDFANTNPSSFTITVDGTTSEELILAPGLSGVGLREGVRDLLRTSTLANNFSSIIVDRATISGTATDIVRLVFDDSDTHSFTAAFTNNNGTLANTSSFGNLVNPGAAATPSTIMFTADNTEQTPNSFSLTLGRVDTAEGIAEAVNDMINTLNTNNITFTLSSTVAGRVITVVDSIRRAQNDVTLVVTTAGTSNLALPTSIINVTTQGTDDTDVTINGNVPTSGTISLTNFYNGSAT